MPTISHSCKGRFGRCDNVVAEGFYCAECRENKTVTRDKHRTSPSRRGYGVEWRRARLMYLKRNPLCVECMSTGHVTAAQEVDHITPHNGNPKLFWDSLNWQSLCKPCHSRKTLKENLLCA